MRRTPGNPSATIEVGVIGAADDFLCTTLLDGDEQIGRSCGCGTAVPNRLEPSVVCWKPRGGSVKLAWAMTVVGAAPLKSFASASSSKTARHSRIRRSLVLRRVAEAGDEDLVQTCSGRALRNEVVPLGDARRRADRSSAP